MNSETPERKYYPISNDKMFAAVLASNPDLAQQMIETILDIRIDHVVCVNAQQILNYNANVKSVRFDVYIKDQAGVIYDVEMQASPKNRRWLPKRSRYYGSVIDAETVKSGTSYKDIKNTYIIFICTYDPFDEGLARYTGKTMCVEDRGVTMEDGITHIYLNARAVRKNVSEELAVLLDYIAGKEEKSSELTDALQREVNRYNKDEDWRHWSMTFEEELNEAREEARQEMMENIFFAFAMFRDGKSDEEKMGVTYDQITEFDKTGTTTPESAYAIIERMVKQSEHKRRMPYVYKRKYE